MVLETKLLWVIIPISRAVYGSSQCPWNKTTLGCRDSFTCEWEGQTGPQGQLSAGGIWP